MDKDIFSIFSMLDDDFSGLLRFEPRLPLWERARNRGLYPIPKLQDEDAFISPRMDITETEKNYLIKFDIPGVKKEDLKVAINGDMLEVKASVKKEVTEKENKHYTERYYGNYYRSLEIPENVDKDSIKVSYTDGVLEISIEKKELPKPEVKELPIA